MTYTQACANALTQSRDGCAWHVNATLVLCNDSPTIDPRGYYVSEWVDGTTLATYSNGACVNTIRKVTMA